MDDSFTLRVSYNLHGQSQTGPFAGPPENTKNGQSEKAQGRFNGRAWPTVSGAAHSA